MNIVSYKDYKNYKPSLYKGLNKQQCALFNAVAMKYLLDKFSKYYGEDLLEEEKSILNDLVAKIWDEHYTKIEERVDLSNLIARFDKVGLEEDGDPRDLYPETIDTLGTINYAASENNGNYETTISYVIEILTDGIDRALDEKYPEYSQTSLSDMFAYKEMQEELKKIENIVELIKTNVPPNQILRKLIDKI